ncbi:hypothetical protein Aperf_G00000088422 [Anoplocephala perfoliata]
MAEENVAVAKTEQPNLSTELPGSSSMMKKQANQTSDIKIDMAVTLNSSKSATYNLRGDTIPDQDFTLLDLIDRVNWKGTARDAVQLPFLVVDTCGRDFGSNNRAQRMGGQIAMIEDLSRLGPVENLEVIADAKDPRCCLSAKPNDFTMAVSCGWWKKRGSDRDIGDSVLREINEVLFAPVIAAVLRFGSLHTLSERLPLEDVGRAMIWRQLKEIAPDYAVVAILRMSVGMPRKDIDLDYNGLVVTSFHRSSTAADPNMANDIPGSDVVLLHIGNEGLQSIQIHLVVGLASSLRSSMVAVAKMDKENPHRSIDLAGGKLDIDMGIDSPCRGIDLSIGHLDVEGEDYFEFDLAPSHYSNGVAPQDTDIGNPCRGTDLGIGRSDFVGKVVHSYEASLVVVLASFHSSGMVAVDKMEMGIRSRSTDMANDKLGICYMVANPNMANDIPGSDVVRFHIGNKDLQSIQIHLVVGLASSLRSSMVAVDKMDKENPRRNIDLAGGKLDIVFLAGVVEVEVVVVVLASFHHSNVVAPQDMGIDSPCRGIDLSIGHLDVEGEDYFEFDLAPSHYSNMVAPQDTDIDSPCRGTDLGIGRSDFVGKIVHSYEASLVDVLASFHSSGMVAVDKMEMGIRSRSTDMANGKLDIVNGVVY